MLFECVFPCAGGGTVRSGIGASQRSQGGWTPLIRAARHGHMDCTRALLEAGADKEAKTNVRDLMQLKLKNSVFILQPHTEHCFLYVPKAT